MITKKMNENNSKNQPFPHPPPPKKLILTLNFFTML